MAVFLDALLYAAVAIILTLTTREFRLYNLAAGAWVVLGGWLAASCYGVVTGTGVPLHPLVFLVFLVVAAAQIISPLILGNKFRNDELRYMTLSVGAALALMNFGPNNLLTSYGATISLPAGVVSQAVFIVVAVAAGAVVLAAARGARWAKAVFTFRASSVAAPGRALAVILLLEWLLLLVLGASAHFVHKGIFDQSEYLTVIPILAVMATNGRPLLSAALASAVVLCSHLAQQYLSNDSIQYLPIAILVLSVLVAIRRWPVSDLLGCRVNHSLPVSERRNDHLFNGLVSLGILVLFSAAAWAWSNASSHAPNRALFIAGLTTVAWLALRYLGVLSIAWPTMGMTILYAVAVAGSDSLLASAAVVVGVVVWSAYLWVLRFLPFATALLVDLSLVVSLHRFVLSSTLIAGAENQRAFDPFGSGTGVSYEVLFGVQVALACAVLVSAVFINHLRRARPYVIALGNVVFGHQHGFHGRWIFLTFAAGLVTLAAVMSGVFHTRLRVLTPDEMSVVGGLTILLLASLGQSIRLPVVYLGIFAIFMVLQMVALGTGSLYMGIVGIVFVALSLFVTPIGGKK